MITGRVVFNTLALAMSALLVFSELTAAQDNYALPGGLHYGDDSIGGGIPMWLAGLMAAAFVVVFGISIGLWRSILLVATVVAIYGTMFMTVGTLGVIGSVFVGIAAGVVTWKVLHAVLPIPVEDE